MIIVPRQDFSSDMKQQHLLAFLNSKRISYDICEKLRSKSEKANNMLWFLDNPYVSENDIQASDFNLKSFECWSKYLSLTEMEKYRLQDVIGNSCL